LDADLELESLRHSMAVAKWGFIYGLEDAKKKAILA